MSEPMRVAVLMGGDSAEREISLLTGQAVAEALQSRGHQVTPVDMRDPLEAIEPLSPGAIDVVFVALHGGSGEDGRVQALLELAGLTYVGSGPLACGVSMDKVLTKRVCKSAGVPTPAWAALSGAESAEQVVERASGLGGDVVLKPIAEGSAIDVHVRPDAQRLTQVWNDPARHSGRWMLEQYIAGRELTLPMLWGDPTPIVEIRPKQGFYDYRNKYTPGRTDYDCPARLELATIEEISDAGEALWEAIGLQDMARIDFRLDDEGRAWCLEVNTIPGMTATSLLPMGARQIGLEFDELCERLCECAQSDAAFAGGTP